MATIDGTVTVNGINWTYANDNYYGLQQLTVCSGDYKRRVYLDHNAETAYDKDHALNYWELSAMTDDELAQWVAATA